ncbi:tumor necrosis factor receptor superfamily member 9-like [Erpetoichthys calabaricus]|uniref:TNFR-Cys domain-containing protein n=1 Tax=Erpetoichthys calabaricus TaxID=27687 RepID=A0A8C4X6V2_ERPCA|nr:tumor necrosis factor receptor superfamily member 9-like [Erpetoichthys calabaricus]
MKTCTALLPLAICGFFLSCGVLHACDSWEPDRSNIHNVCCKKCSAGSRHTGVCGPDQSTLCVSCVPGTFNIDPESSSCTRCRICTGKLTVKEPCTSTRNTVCTCVEGFKCVDAECSRCIKQCGKGEETFESGCKKCDSGTFNDKVDGICKPWKKRCRNGEIIKQNGTAESDVLCEPIQTTPSTVTAMTVVVTKKPNTQSGLEMAALLTAASVTMIVILVVLVMFFVTHIYKKKGAGLPVAKTPVVQVAQEEDTRSCRCPEEEQGDSEDSSEMCSKLLLA